MIVNVFQGKELEVFTWRAVSTFKSGVLWAYELRPEAYRLLFRNARKRARDTYVAFARYLSDTMDKWLHSGNVTTLEKIRELFLIEQFTNCADRDNGDLLREKRITSIKATT